MGMNRGYSTLWFAQNKKCKAVYGFEIDKDTYNFAANNFKVNQHLSGKINMFDFGLSNKDKEIDLTFIPGEDSVSTTEEKFVNDYYTNERKLKLQKKPATLKKTSTILKKLIEKDNITSPLVLKIDVEGAEYDILEDLVNANLLSKFSIIIGECYYGMEGITKYLKGFKLINQTKITENLYNFCFIKNDE
jgi:FkbM family methyltransferase